MGNLDDLGNNETNKNKDSSIFSCLNLYLLFSHGRIRIMVIEVDPVLAHLS